MKKAKNYTCIEYKVAVAKQAIIWREGKNCIFNLDCKQSWDQSNVIKPHPTSKLNYWHRYQPPSVSSASS